jgi:antitoxin HigA-1
MTWKLSTITDTFSESSMKRLPNIHPGEILLEEFLEPLGISQNAIARAAGVPPRRINEIVLGKRGITADTAIRLARVLGTTERFWLGLQNDYDLEEARRALGKAVNDIEPLAA